MKISAAMQQTASRFLSINTPLTLAAGLSLVTVPAKLFTFNKAFDYNQFNAEDKKLLMTQEWARQIVSSGLWMGSLVASWGVSRQLFPKQQALFHLLSANAISTLVDVGLRPFATAKLTRVFMGQQANRNLSQPSKGDNSIRSSSVSNNKLGVLKQQAANSASQANYGYYYWA